MLKVWNIVVLVAHLAISGRRVSVLQNIYQTAMRHWKKVLEVDWKAGTQDYVYNNRLHAMW